MTRDRPSLRVNPDATEEEHLKCIRTHRHHYLARALKQVLPTTVRNRIVTVALRYLEERPRSQSSSYNLSQGAAPLSQSSTPPPSADASFYSLLACLIDRDLPGKTLEHICEIAANQHNLSLLSKTLAVLAHVGHLPDSNESQSQYQEEELQSTLPNQNHESVDPQNVQQRETPKPDVNQSGRRTGQHFVNDFVSKLVSAKVAPRLASAPSPDVFVASVAREAPLSEHATNHVLRHLVCRLSRVDLFELPAFIYQLLLFASARAHPVAKSNVLLHIADTCTERENQARRSDALSQSILDDDEDAIIAVRATLKDLRVVQGTALLHIEYAVKQDPTLSNEIVKLAKAGVENPRHFLNSFGTGILLSLARSASVQTDVLLLLRDAICRFDKECSIRRMNMFSNRVSLNDKELLNPRKSLLHIAESTCQNGWDYVKESLLQFAFLLLDKPLQEQSSGSTASLAATLLIQLFKSHHGMRDAILENLTTRIALQEKSALQSILIIHEISTTVPFFVLEYHNRIRDGVELLVTLPPWLASALIQAYKALFTSRQDLQEYFLLVVRKSLFHRDASSRAVSIIGFLNAVSLFASARGNVGPSQMTQSKQEQKLDAMVETLQPLRRVFAYPAALKAFWYSSAIEHMESASTVDEAKNLAGALGGILLPHLHRYIDAEKAPYLLLDHCVKESAGGALDEPLGELIWCLAVAESKRDPEEYHESYIVDLARKLASVSLQDFPVSKEPLVAPSEEQSQADEENGAVNTARANRNQIRILGCVSEALIHSVLIVEPRHQGWQMVLEVLVPLLLLKGKIIDLLNSAKIATPGDAFRDLGGVLGIERLRPGARLVYTRGGKQGGAGKKNSKKKGGDKGPGDQGNAQMQQAGHRFGVFSVLTSAYSKPNLPLIACVRLLTLMHAAVIGKEAADNFFSGHADSQDFNELKSYLLVVAQKHIENFVLTFTKSSPDESPKTENELSNMSEAIETVVAIAMSEFKRYRRTSGNTPGHGGIKALSVAETCASALPFTSDGDVGAVVSFCKALLPPATSSVFDDNDSQFETAADALEKLVETLTDDLMFKEVGIVMNVHGTLVKCIAGVSDPISVTTTFLLKREAWAIQMLGARKISDSGVVKTLVRICLTYVDDNNDLRNADEICERLLEVIGDCNEAAEPPDRNEEDNRPLAGAEAIEQSTSLAVVDAMLDAIENVISDIEWGSGRMTSLDAAHSLYWDQENEGVGQDEEKERILSKLFRLSEKALLTRLQGLVRTLGGLARCAIAKWSQQERLLKLITRTYKNLSSTTQAHAKRSHSEQPRVMFMDMINEGKRLAPTLWAYLGFLGSKSVEEVSGKGASKAAKEARVMPQLIYEVERFEKVLIAAQKKTKTNLLRGMRRNTARDFRIREELLQHDDAEQDEDDGEADEGEAAGDGDDNDDGADEGNDNGNEDGHSNRRHRGRGGGAHLVSKRRRTS